MRRISSYIPLIAALAATCWAGQTVATGIAAAATSPTVDKAALNKAVQEALAKAQAGKGAGAQGATGAAGAGAAPGGNGGSLGSSEALSNLTNGGGEEEAAAQTTPTTTSSSSSGVSTSVLVPIFAAGAVLLLGIAFFIVRDARSVAPVGGGLGGAGSSQDRAARQRKRRAKAKAARRQRKRNR
jgi:cobalamin biosynthesis Mg chelatase CobN